MSDIPFWGGGSGGGTGGVSNYDKLSNKPVTNISGSGIVISSLSTGVYNIDGTWKITPDDDERETLKDDLFYVKNDGDNVKLTWISAGLIKTYGVLSDGGKDDIVEDSVATSSAVIADMIGSF
ncbi:hypothetical protein [Faecalibacterium sp.]|uniref:hypothetical protein n=1 Tax=Faecalibacterium sp. TaxID=1971605 RepID=UPI0025C367DF|nr:hypothetical protein [Faecalibacterium sp.]